MHGFFTYAEDDDGFVTAGCQCGWSASPVPGVEDAADCYGDHMFGAGYETGTATARLRHLPVPPRRRVRTPHNLTAALDRETEQ